jgi:phage/plasmid-like protein (TIGR03299 family)
MAHEITDNQAFFVEKPAWHGLGVTLSEAPTPAEAWKLAYPGTVHKVPLKGFLGEDAIADAPGSYGMYRSSGEYLGHVGENYEVLQPEEHFRAFEPYIDAGIIDLETGMALRGGKRIAILAKLKNADADILPGDSVRGYWLLHASFDGSLALGCKGTGIRVVCANTLAMSLRDGQKQIKIRHTKNMREKLADAQETLAKELAGFQKDVEAMQHLAKSKVSRKQQIDYIANVFLAGKTEEERENPPTVTVNKIQHVIDLLDQQRGLDLVPASRGTAWQAYNAISEYVTHDHGRSVDSRLNGQFFGDSARLNARAFSDALTMC